jgi:hypothetical protein
MRAPRARGEPHSAGDKQHHYREEQMFCFHSFLPFVSSFTSTFGK